MNIVRCGERPTFARTPLLAAAVVCAALTGCSAGSAGVPFGGSGGDPLGEGQTSGSGSSSGGGATDDASSPPGTHVDASTKGGPPTTLAPVEGSSSGGPTDAGTRSAEDTGSPLTTFSLLNTNVTTLVDGEPLLGFDPIAENAVLDLGKLGTALSIRANTTPAVVGSVEFVLDGTYKHTENVAPYTLCSDNGAGTITTCPFTLGAHILVATPYSGPNLADAASPSTTLYFTVVDSADGGTDAAKD
jgi:hypothetical protein